MEITNIIALVFLMGTGIMLFFGVRNWWPVKPTPKAKSSPSATTTAGTSGSSAAVATATSLTPPTPAPATAVSTRSWRWLWWIPIIIVAAFIGRWVWYEGRDVKSVYSPPKVGAPGRAMQAFQQFPIVIDPLSYNRTKSKKVRAGTGTDGNMTIVVEPGGEVVYDVNIAGEIPPANNPFLKLDIYLWPSKTQSMGYQVNDIRHDSIRVGQFGRETFIPQPREFHQGVNEIAFFAKGELKIDGDRKITISR